MARGIAVVGANGSGKSTLGRELARRLGCRFLDIEDYYFLESDVPYAVSRTREETQALMLADLEKCGSFVLAAVNGNLGPAITASYDMAVLLSAPFEVRMERIRRRSLERFGERVLPGGDMYGREQEFYRFAASRSPAEIERWAEALPCPLIRADGTEAAAENAGRIASLYLSACRESGKFPGKESMGP